MPYVFQHVGSEERVCARHSPVLWLNGSVWCAPSARHKDGTVFLTIRDAPKKSDVIHKTQGLKIKLTTQIKDIARPIAFSEPQGKQGAESYRPLNLQ